MRPVSANFILQVLRRGWQGELTSLVLSSFIPKDSKDIPIYMVSEGGSRFALNHNRRDLKVRWEKHGLEEGVLGYMVTL